MPYLSCLAPWFCHFGGIAAWWESHLTLEEKIPGLTASSGPTGLYREQAFHLKFGDHVLESPSVQYSYSSYVLSPFSTPEHIPSAPRQLENSWVASLHHTDTDSALWHCLWTSASRDVPQPLLIDCLGALFLWHHVAAALHWMAEGLF